MKRRRFIEISFSGCVLPGCSDESGKVPSPKNSFSQMKSTSFTTRPAPIDIAAKYPALVPLARITVRLHPRQQSNLPIIASKIGGTFHANDPASWPRCSVHETAHIGILQLLKDDVPELQFPDRSDLFQLTFCPFDHNDAYCPDIAGRWLSVEDTANQIETNPSYVWPSDKYAMDYNPKECAVHPERVTEYPRFEELPASLQEGIGRDFDLVKAVREILEEPDEEWAPATSYNWFLSVADGTKVGGYINWIQGPEYPICPQCKNQTDHLLTLASWEWDGGTYHRWKPIESRAKGSVVSADGGNDHGMMFGDAGAIYIGVCRRCEGFPVARSFQCS